MLKEISFCILSLLLWATPALAEYEEYSPENDVALAAMQAGDQEQALEIWRRLAKEGDARAISNMGMIFQHGVGVEQNIDRAVELFRRSANAGFSAGQHNLAVMYRDGNGIVQDKTAAFGWARLAALQNYREAQRFLLNAYAAGDGTPINYARAYMWLLILIEDGDEKAISVRAEMEGDIGQEAIEQGRIWAERCDLDNPVNCG